MQINEIAYAMFMVMVVVVMVVIKSEVVLLNEETPRHKSIGGRRIRPIFNLAKLKVRCSCPRQAPWQQRKMRGHRVTAGKEAGYPLNRKLFGLQTRSGRLVQEESPCLYQDLNPRSSRL